MNRIAQNLAFGSCACAALWCGNANAVDGGWDWIVAPYLWGVQIRTDLDTSVPPGGISTDTKFHDILSSFDGAFQIHGEGQGDQWGVFADFTFLGLSDQNDYPRFRTDSDLDMRLFEAAAVWNPSPGRFEGLDLFGGLRYVDVDLTTDLHPLNPAFPTSFVKLGKGYADFMLGGRYTWSLSDRWGLTVRGDGSWGDTEGTWNASAMAQYRTDSGAWYFGYRYLDVEVEDHGDSGHAVMDGPQVGYGFHF